MGIRMKNFMKSKFLWAGGIGALYFVYPFIPTFFTEESLEEGRIKRTALTQVVTTNTKAMIGQFTDQYSQSVAAQHEAAQVERDQALAAEQQQRQVELDAQQAPIREVADSVKVFASGVAQMGANFNAGLTDVNGRVTNLEQSIQGIDKKVDQSIVGLNAKLDHMTELINDKETVQPQAAPVDHGQVSVNRGSQVVAPIKSNCPPSCDCQKGVVHYGSVQPVGNRVHSYRTR